MVPSVKRTIQKFFPNDDVDAIQRHFASFDGDPGHPREAVHRAELVQISEGNEDRLVSVIRWWQVDPEAFNKYRTRYLHWIREADGYESHSADYLRWFAPVIRDFADRVSQFACLSTNSHRTLCVYDPRAQTPFPAPLYLVPLMDQQVYVSSSAAVTTGPKTAEIVEFGPGELCSAVSLPNTLDTMLPTMFDCDAPIPGT